MAWTAPRTYVANELVSAAILNVDLRDNLTALSTHAHAGAAGDGNDELSGLDVLAFDNVAASPNAAGELQRNGSNLEWYGAAVVAITQADAAAATASPRTLGTGALQGAPGNHSHTSTNLTMTAASAASAATAGGTRGDDRIGYYDILAGATQTVHNVTSTKKIAAFLFALASTESPSGGSIKMSIEADGVEMASVTWADGFGVAGPYYLLAVKVKATADINWVSKVLNNGTVTRRVTIKNAQFADFMGGTTTDPKAGLAQADLGVV
mgnify:CR=1 FL=1